MKYVKVKIGGVVKYIADSDTNGLRKVARVGGEPEKYPNGKIKYYYPQDIEKPIGVTSVSAEDIFG